MNQPFLKLPTFALFIPFCPRVAQRNRAVESQRVIGRIHGIDAEIALSLELEPATGRRARETWFHLA